MKNELKPCPFCGSSSAPVVVDSIEKDGDYDNPIQYQVVCDWNEVGCGSATGYRYTIEEAVELWNARQ